MKKNGKYTSASESARRDRDMYLNCMISAADNRIKETEDIIGDK